MIRETAIRDYAPDADFDEVFRLAREIISEPPYEEAREELERYPNRELVARIARNGEGEIVGFCAGIYPYWNRVAMIDYLVVAPGSRRQGLGQRLVEAIEGELRQARARCVCVQTPPWNVDAIRFYERLGYVRLAVLPGYFGKGNDAAWLSRDLEAESGD
jgi:ribosomal protein S18 acetylase RimI-like enzyme